MARRSLDKPVKGSGGGGGLAVAVHELVEALPEFLEQLPAALEELFWAVLVPTALILALLLLASLVIKRIQRVLYPPGPEALHKEAILLLRQCNNSKQSSSKNAMTKKPLAPVLQKRLQRRNDTSMKRAIATLLQASTQQRIVHSSRTGANAATQSGGSGSSPSSENDNSTSPSYYAPAILSLAALYVYNLEDGASAVKLLESTLLSKNKSSSSRVAPTHLSDSQSILLDAQAVMAGQGHMIQRDLRHDEFLAVSYCEASSVALSSLSSSTTTSSRNAPVKASSSSKKKQ